jgi:hypothetical protein
MLRNFLQTAEKDKKTHELYFPYGILSEIGEIVENKRLVTLKRIFNQQVDANELVVLHRVLENRDWKVSYG